MNSSVAWSRSMDLKREGDHSFVLARSFGIMVMQGGFALLEAGCVHIANRGNIMMCAGRRLPPVSA